MLLIDSLSSTGPLKIGYQSTSDHTTHGSTSLPGETRIAGKRCPPSNRGTRSLFNAFITSNASTGCMIHFLGTKNIPSWPQRCQLFWDIKMRARSHLEGVEGSYIYLIIYWLNWHGSRSLTKTRVEVIKVGILQGGGNQSLRAWLPICRSWSLFPVRAPKINKAASLISKIDRVLGVCSYALQHHTSSTLRTSPEMLPVLL